MNWKPLDPEQMRRDLISVNPLNIVQLVECQPRVEGTDPKFVADYAEDMRAYDEKDTGKPGWCKFPPIECVRDPERGLILYSGFHRLAAILEVGYTEIAVSVQEGTRQDAIVLSKRENAANGKRRTNADKAHVVKSCLLDDELKLWSNPTIAKWCGVSARTVANHEKSLGNFPSENGETYTRPTRRKRLSKHGEIEWVETASIGNGSESKAEAVKARENDCKARLRSILDEHHKLDNTVYNVAEFAKEFDLYAVRVETIARDMVAAATEKARAEWQKAWTKIRTAWFDNEELSKSVEWETFTAAALEQVDMVFLTEDTFENPNDRLKSDDLKLLIGEKNCLITLGYHVRNPSMWVSALMPNAHEQDLSEDEAIERLSDAVVEFDEYFMGDVGFDHADYGLLCDLVAVEFGCDRDVLYKIVYEEDFPEGFDTSDMLKWEKIVRQMLKDAKSNAGWVAKLRAGEAETEHPSETDEDAPSVDIAAVQRDTEKADALEKFTNQKHELYKLIDETPLVQVKDEFGNINTDKARHRVMVAAYKAYDLPEDLLWTDQMVESLTTEELRNLTSKYFLIMQDFAASTRPDWVAALYQVVEDVKSPHPSKPLDDMDDDETEKYFDYVGEHNALSDACDKFFGSWSEHLRDVPFQKLLDCVSKHFGYDRIILGEIADVELVRKAFTECQRKRVEDILLESAKAIETMENWVKVLLSDEAKTAEAWVRVVVQFGSGTEPGGGLGGDNVHTELYSAATSVRDNAKNENTLEISNFAGKMHKNLITAFESLSPDEEETDETN